MTDHDRTLRWLFRAHRGEVDLVRQEILAMTDRTSDDQERAALVSALACAYYYGRRFTDAVQLCQREIGLGRVPEPWRAQLLAVRGASRVDLGEIDDAISDLIDAEVGLSRCVDPRTELGIRRVLAAGYRELSLFDRAVAHYLRVDELGREIRSPYLLGVTTALGIAQVKYKWAKHLARITDGSADEVVRGRLTGARAWLATARERACHREPHPWQRLQLALDREITTLLEPEVGVPLLEDLIRTSEWDRERSLSGGRPADVTVHEPTSTDGLAVSLAVLSSGMLRLGQVDRAEALARRAHEVATTRGQVHLSTVEEVEDARHQAELALGLPGAITARACMVELRAELARYREDWVQAIQDRLHHALADRELTLVEHQTLIDPLTGLHNRLGWEQWFLRRRRGPMVVVLMDVDGLKAVNDRHGHVAGDMLLERWGRQLRRRLPPGVMAARFGGDEFVLGWAGRSDDQAVRQLEHLCRRALAAVDLTSLGLSTPTASMGAAIAGPGEPIADLLERADERMYLDKAARER